MTMYVLHIKRHFCVSDSIVLDPDDEATARAERLPLSETYLSTRSNQDLNPSISISDEQTALTSQPHDPLESTLVQSDSIEHASNTNSNSNYSISEKDSLQHTSSHNLPKTSSKNNCQSKTTSESLPKTQSGSVQLPNTASSDGQTVDLTTVNGQNGPLSSKDTAIKS